MQTGPEQAAEHRTVGSITTRLQGAKALIQRRRLVLGCVTGLGLLSTGVLLIEAVNRIFPLRETWALAAVGVAVLLGAAHVVAQWFCSVFRTPRAERLALAVEDAHPEFMDAVACAVEVEAVPEVDRNPIAQALLQDVHRRSGAVDFVQAVLPEHLRWPRILTLLGIFVALGVFALHAQILAKARFRFLDALQRTNSGLAVSPGSEELPEHSDLRVEVDVRRWGNSAEIVYRDGKTNRFLMNRGNGRHHFFTFYDVIGTIEYRILTPGLASRWYTIHAYRPPEFARAEIALSPPAYTGRKPLVLDALRDCSAVVGSEVKIALDVVPGITATLVRSGQAGTPGGEAEKREAFVPHGADRLVFEHTLIDSFTAFVELRGPHGRSAATQPFTIKAEPDLVPVVDVLVPREDVKVKPGAKLDVEARAGDDFAVSRVALMFTVSGGERQEVILHSAPTKGTAGDDAAPVAVPAVTDLNVAHLFDIDGMGLTPGDVVSYLFVVQDNRSPNPQKARSEIYFIEVRPDIKPEEQDSQGEQQQMDVSNLIAETKRLIRLTWEAMSAEGDDQGVLADDLLRAMKDLHTEGKRKVNEMLEASGGTPDALSELLGDAVAEIAKAQGLIGNRLLEESLPSQERALAKLVQVENELMKNAARGKEGEEGDSEGEEEQKEQKKGEKGGAQQSHQEKLAAMRQMLEELRKLGRQQANLNEAIRRQASKAAAEVLNDALAEKQSGLKQATSALSAQIKELPEAVKASRIADVAAREMASGAERLDADQLDLGERHGSRAHNFLLEATRALEESHRQESANEIARLASLTQQLSNMQRQAAEKSRGMSAEKNVSKEARDAARDQQKGLNKAAGKLLTDIERASAELEDAYPDAAQALAEATQGAREGDLSAKMTRAANSLLYRRFDRARRYQTDSANVLQQLSSELGDAAKKLPAMSREELTQALRKLQAADRRAEQLGKSRSQAAKRQLDALQQRMSQEVDGLSAQLQDPTLQEIGDEMGMPAGAGDITGDSQRLRALLKAAARVIEKHLFTTEVRKRYDLSKRTSAPPERYRRLVEQYFKDLSRTK